METSTRTDGTDALLEIVISEAGDAAVVMPTPRLLQSKEAITQAMVESLAKISGVRVPLDKQGLAQLLSTKPNEFPAEGIVIAKAIQPRAARNAGIEWHGDPTLPIFPGDVFAHLLPPEEQRPGTTVDGRATDAPKIPLDPDVTLAPDGGMTLDEQSREITAKRYGLARLDQGKLSIVPLLTVSADGLQVAGAIYPKDFFGDPMLPSRIRDALRVFNIKVDLKIENITQAIREARKTGIPQENVLMAEGRPPIDGTDGYFDPAFKGIQSGAMLESGRIDFMERGAVQSVLEGQVLGRVMPPGHGKPGLSVFGEPLLARDGQAFKLSAGEGVTMAEDGQTYLAKIAGVVVFSQSKLAVTDLFTVDKDVDYSVGNLRLDKGSVHINGNVLDGFSITTPGNAYVGQVVEGASISAGGDVIIRGGLAMGKKGRIKAGGNIVAKFALHAVLVAEGDVDMGAITDCDINAEGRILCLREKGTIVGGTIRSSKGVEAKEVGSELGVATHIVLGLQVKQSEELQAERKSLKEQITKISNTLGAGSPKEILNRTPESRRQAVAELIKALLRLCKALDEVNGKIREEQMLARKSMQAMLKVQKAIYPGVSITIGGLTTHVKETIQFAKVFYDSQAGRIIMESLA